MEGFVLRRVQEIERSSKPKGNVVTFQGDSENLQPNVPHGTLPCHPDGDQPARCPQGADAPFTPGWTEGECRRNSAWGGPAGRVGTPHHTRQPLLYNQPVMPVHSSAALLANGTPTGRNLESAFQDSTHGGATGAHIRHASSHDALAYAGATPARAAPLSRAPMTTAGAHDGQASVLFSPLSAPARRVPVRPKTPSSKQGLGPTPNPKVSSRPLSSSSTPQGKVRRALGLSAYEPTPPLTSLSSASPSCGPVSKRGPITSQPAPRPAWVNPSTLVAARHVSFSSEGRTEPPHPHTHVHRSHAGGAAPIMTKGSAASITKASVPQASIPPAAPSTPPLALLDSAWVPDGDVDCGIVDRDVPDGDEVPGGVARLVGSSEWPEGEPVPRTPPAFTGGGDDAGLSGTSTSGQGEGQGVQVGRSRVEEGGINKRTPSASSRGGLGGAAMRVLVTEHGSNGDDGGVDASRYRTPTRPSGPVAVAGLDGSLAALFLREDEEEAVPRLDVGVGHDDDVDDSVAVERQRFGVLSASEVTAGGSVQVTGGSSLASPLVMDACRAVLTPVRASKGDQRLLGTQVILTPVRRSCRTAKPVGWDGFDTTGTKGRAAGGLSSGSGAESGEPMLEDLLEQTGYTYTPNKALRGANMYLHPPPRRPRIVASEAPGAITDNVNGADGTVAATSSAATDTMVTTGRAGGGPPLLMLPPPTQPMVVAPPVASEPLTHAAGLDTSTHAASQNGISVLDGPCSAPDALTCHVAHGPALMDAHHESTEDGRTLFSQVSVEDSLTPSKGDPPCSLPLMGGLSGHEGGDGPPGWQLSAFVRMMAAVARAAMRQQAEEEGRQARVAGASASGGEEQVVPADLGGSATPLVTPGSLPSAAKGAIIKAPVKGKRTPRARRAKAESTPAPATVTPLPLAQALVTPLAQVLMTPGTPEETGGDIAGNGSEAGWKVSPEVIFGGECEAKQETAATSGSTKGVVDKTDARDVEEGNDGLDQAHVALRRSARKAKKPSALLQDFECTPSARKARGGGVRATQGASREPLVSSLASQLEQAAAELLPQQKKTGRRSNK